jgi:hypothetical protein
MQKLAILFIFSLFLMASCKDVKSEKSPETNTETKQLAAMAYQCPMNCESGKTYDKAGICPVCKMDLKVNKSETSMNYVMHKDGNCSCNANKPSEHKSSENGEKVDYAIHSDGKCNCEGDLCSCEKCLEHA